jgi:hypothetical protein
MRRIGADCSIAARTTGSFENVAVNAPAGPSDGVDNQTISQGSKPRIAKTANTSPHKRNQRFARLLIIESTSALIMALSMLVIVSNNMRPVIIRTIEKRSITQRKYWIQRCLNMSCFVWDKKFRRKNIPHISGTIPYDAIGKSMLVMGVAWGIDISGKP